ncbi:MAG: M20/M25/M40 family metallo-hydrolase [Anaerolineae bacterium]|nr:M20/M25/M40 family metallo-hydrolase [Anaerolineae bacterium]MDW8102098.1 M20/M25/M40 family metallo-hydrolase [Anaerolineae bacterium]
MKERIKRWLKTLVEIPSPTGEEGGFQLYLRENLHKLGFESELQEVAPSRPNLLAWRGVSPLLIVTHSDTSPASEYNLREEGGFFYGPGVADAKGQIAALLSVLEINPSPLTLAFTVDEEARGEGSKNLCLPPWVKMAVVLEPTELKVAIAQSGSLDLEMVIKGEKAHGAYPEAGENAILKAFEVIAKIQSLEFMQLEHHLLGKPHIMPYWIKGGHPELYLVPDEALLRFDLKLVPPLSPEMVLAEIQEAVAHYGYIKVLDFDPPFEISPEAQIVNLVKESIRLASGQEAELTGMPSWTDAEPLYRKGIEVVIFGAGNLSLAHTEKEQINIGELMELAAVLDKLILLTSQG